MHWTDTYKHVRTHIHIHPHTHGRTHTGAYKDTDVYSDREDYDHLDDEPSSRSLTASLLNELKVLGMLVTGSSVFICAGTIFHYMLMKFLK